MKVQADGPIFKYAAMLIGEFQKPHRDILQVCTPKCNKGRKDECERVSMAYLSFKSKSEKEAEPPKSRAFIEVRSTIHESVERPRAEFQAGPAPRADVARDVQVVE